MSGLPPGLTAAPTPQSNSATMPEMIRSAASMAGVPFDIAYRLVKQESAFNPRAHNPSGASGLTQLEPDTAKELGVSDIWNPADNLAGGMKYLAQQYKKYGNWRDALAAYNWGPGNVDSWLKNGGNVAHLPGETRAYVAAIAPSSFTEVQHGLASTKVKPQSRLELLGRRAPALPPGLSEQPQSLPPGLSTAPSSPVPAPTAAPQATPTPQPTAMPSFSNPMDQPGGDVGPIGGIGAPMAQSALSSLAGHQDLLFIMHNAQLRDAASGRDLSMLELGKDPKSYVSQALALWKQNPGAARDEFGLGSPRQNAFMAKAAPNSGEGMFAGFMQNHPWVNAGLTNAEELIANPMAMAEGGAAGKTLEGAGALARATGLAPTVAKAAQTVAHQVGMGSPLAEISAKHGVEGSQWAKATIASVAAPHKLLHAASTDEAVQHIFGGLSPAEQTEVGRLAQGLKPNPAFEAKHAELAQRAKLLVADRDMVTAHQLRVGTLTPDQIHRNFLPMKNSYSFGPQADLEAELRGGAAPGGGNTAARHKTFQNLDQAIGSGNLSPDFLLANNYAQWRHARLQNVAFEDALQRAPESLRRDIQAADYTKPSGEALTQPWQRTAAQTPQEALEQKLAENRAQFPQDHPERFELRQDDPRYVAAYRVLKNTPSPTLQKSMIAPELLSFVRGNGALAKYLGEGGYLPGQTATSWGGRFIQFARNAIVANFAWHPAVNIAGNDAAARSLYGLGGPQMEAQGYIANAAKALAHQLPGVDPTAFAKGADKYASWLDRALKAGGVAEFGSPRVSALGGERTRVLTTPATKWNERLDQTLTQIGDFNRERTFGQRGEEAFAVSLFKDAVQRGKMSDAEAGQVVRQALGDYYNMDPSSPISAVSLFMPWRKGNWQFWTNVLVRKPNLVTAPVSAIRNLNLQRAPQEMQGPYAAPDFEIKQGIGKLPLSLPFVGRDIATIADIPMRLAQGAQGAPFVGETLNDLQRLALGSANPIAATLLNARDTANAIYRHDVTGPETDFNQIVNVRAPAGEQIKQIRNYFTGKLPVPLIGFALQNAARRGFAPSDIVPTLAAAAGLGYTGEAALTDDQRRELSRATARFEKASNRYRFGDHDLGALKQAYLDYESTLQAVGKTH